MSERLVQVLDPPSLGAANPVYSKITIVPIGDVKLVTIAGQVATTPTGEIPSSLDEQIELCLSKVETCLSVEDNACLDHREARSLSQRTSTGKLLPGREILVQTRVSMRIRGYGCRSKMTAERT